VYVKATAVMFCSDLQGADKALYKSLVQQTLEAALRARAKSSGLELVGRMPPDPRGGHLHG